jgi:hypothetical protein
MVLLGSLVAPSLAQAVTVIASATLASNAGNYSKLDPEGTALSVTYGPGGSLVTIGPNDFPGATPFVGLSFGSTHGSATYTLTFSDPIQFFSLHVNAMSTYTSSMTGKTFAETIGKFTVNAPSAPSLAFTNIKLTKWDGTTVTSGPQDDGEFTLAITAAAGQSFNTISFYHYQLNKAYGSVIRGISYDLADLTPPPTSVSAVPLPGTLPMFASGLAGLGLICWRRRRSASKPT